MAIHQPLHPGEIVNEILVEGAKLTVTEAAKRLHINRTTLSRFLNGHAGMSPTMALRLSRLFPKTDIVFWLNLQRDYDIWLVRQRQNDIKVKPLDKAA